MTDTTEKKGHPPMVAIDGDRIRGLREEKKLTQLYVASVVGVTTDTISRWENNRYPSIKRDNAEKLAAALEVGLTEILRSVEPTPLEPPAPSRPLMLPALAFILGFLLLGGIVYLYLTNRPGLATARTLPHFAAPGEIIPVQIKVDIKKGDFRGLIVKERLPAGWRMVESAPPGTVISNAAQEIKWLIPGDAGRATISYTVRLPASATLRSVAQFTGEVVAEVGQKTRSFPTRGNSRSTVAPVHWADDNGDGAIDDNEIIPAFYLTDEMKGLGLDWKTIEAIWSGKGYTWDPQKGFAVKR